MSRMKFRRKEQKYTQVYNTIIFKEKDIELTGLYTTIQACIDLEQNTKGTDKEFIVSKKSLQHFCGCGERKFDKNWDNLKKAGYLKQYKIKAANGKFEYEYELLDEPDLTTHHSLIQNEDGSLVPNIPKSRIDKLINESNDKPEGHFVPVQPEGRFVEGAKCRGYYNNSLNKVSMYVSIAKQSFDLTNKNREFIDSIEDKIDLELFEEIVVNAKNKGKTFRYVTSTVNNTLEKGITTLAAFEADVKAYGEKLKADKQSKKAPKKAAGKASNKSNNKDYKVKTRFHNINQRIDKYTEEELNQILEDNQAAKQKQREEQANNPQVEEVVVDMNLVNECMKNRDIFNALSDEVKQQVKVLASKECDFIPLHMK